MSQDKTKEVLTPKEIIEYIDSKLIGNTVPLDVEQVAIVLIESHAQHQLTQAKGEIDVLKKSMQILNDEYVNQLTQKDKEIEAAILKGYIELIEQIFQAPNNGEWIYIKKSHLVSQKQEIESKVKSLLNPSNE